MVAMLVPEKPNSDVSLTSGIFLPSTQTGAAAGTILAGGAVEYVPAGASNIGSSYLNTGGGGTLVFDSTGSYPSAHDGVVLNTASGGGSVLFKQQNSNTPYTYTYAGLGGALTIFDSTHTQLYQISVANLTTNGIIPISASGSLNLVQYRDRDGTTQTYYALGSVTPLACVLEGTEILTPNGKVLVEKLRKGDLVMAYDGNDYFPVAIKWIGFSEKYVFGIHENNAPIRIGKNAISENSPYKDLLVSPGHSIYFDGVLTRAFDLINNKSIYQDKKFEKVKYYHVNLGLHYIINTNGVLSESFFNVFRNDRNKFQNQEELDDQPMEENPSHESK